MIRRERLQGGRCPSTAHRPKNVAELIVEVVQDEIPHDGGMMMWGRFVGNDMTDSRGCSREAYEEGRDVLSVIPDLRCGFMAVAIARLSCALVFCSPSCTMLARGAVVSLGRIKVSFRVLDPLTQLGCQASYSDDLLWPSRRDPC